MKFGVETACRVSSFLCLCRAKFSNALFLTMLMPKNPFSAPILVNNENYYRIVEFLRPEDFYLDAHRVIFRHMIDVDGEVPRHRSGHASGRTAAGRVARKRRRYWLPGRPARRHSSSDQYRALHRDRPRKVAPAADDQYGNKIMAECFDQAEPAEQILDQAEQALFNLSEKRIEGGLCFREGDGSVTTSSFSKSSTKNAR